MIRSSVTVSLVPEARGGPFVFWDDLPSACRTAKALGFDAIEIFAPSADAVDIRQMWTLLADHDLQLAAMGTGAGWVKSRLNLCLADTTARARARAFIREIIDVAGQFAAPAIVGSMQGRHGDGVDKHTAMGYLADALEELGVHAAQYRVPLVLEPLNRYETNLLNTLEDGLGLLNKLSTKNVALLADLFHMNIEETDMAVALTTSAGRLAHLHFVDSNRCPAGLGHLDFAPIAAALKAGMYNGYASAEALPYPDSDAAARQTMIAFKAVFQS